MDEINTKEDMENMVSVLHFIDWQIAEKERLEQLDDDTFVLEVESLFDQLSDKLLIWHDPLLTEILERLKRPCLHHDR